MEVATDFVFWGSKITTDSDCSHEIRRKFLLGRKEMTNLDIVLKSRDITLLTKVHIVKAMVFSVALYGCDSWTIKKSEHQRIDAFETRYWRRLLDSKEINQPILREINLEYPLEGLTLKLKLQYFGHLMQTADSLGKSLMLGKIKGKRKRRHQRMRWLDGITNAVNMNLGKLQAVMSDREPWHVALHVVVESQTQLGD